MRRKLPVLWLSERAVAVEAETGSLRCPVPQLGSLETSPEVLDQHQVGA